VSAAPITTVGSDMRISRINGVGFGAHYRHDEIRKRVANRRRVDINGNEVSKTQAVIGMAAGLFGPLKSAGKGPSRIAGKADDIADTAKAASKAPNTGLFRVGKHGEMPSPRPGQQSRHGAMPAWMKPDFPGYDANREATDSFLAPLSINEVPDAVDPCVSAGSSRCSDKDFLAMSLEDYLLLLDSTARQSSWCELVSDFGKLFSRVAGKPSVVDSMRPPHGHRRMYLRRRACELMTA